MVIAVLSQQLKRLRAEASMSQKELASKLFVSQQAVGKWERDEATPNPETVIKMAEIFGVSTDTLLGKTSPDKTANGISNDGKVTKKDLQAAFWGGEKDLSQEDLDAMWSDVENFAAFVAQKRREAKKND